VRLAGLTTVIVVLAADLGRFVGGTIVV